MYLRSAFQNAKARVKALDSELKSLKWEHDVLEQRFAQVTSRVSLLGNTLYATDGERER